MNGCYCDLPGINFPFNTEDFLTQQDIDILNGKVLGEAVLGNNLGALSGAVGKTHDSAFVKTSKLSWSKNTGNYDTQGTFNGNGIITDHDLKHDVWDWLNETFHQKYFQEVWKISGTNTPPVTVLCFSLNSGWHNEGPIPHVNFDNNLRPPAVINFRLLGDIDNSYIEFAEPDKDMAQAEKEIIELYLETVTGADVNLTVEHKNLIMSNTIHGFYDEYWNDNLNVIETHHGMHNPYIVNVGKWHRVITNGSPRTTLRVHANTDLTFKEIEELVARGEFFKC